MKRGSLWALFPLLLGCSLAGAQQVEIKPEKASGIYQVGETIRWKISVKGEGSPVYRVKTGGYVPGPDQKLEVRNGEAVVTAAAKEPGWLLLEVDATGPDGKPVKKLGGAIIAPERIKPSSEKPADFDKFWDDKMRALKAIPMGAQTSSEDSGRQGVAYEKVTLNGWKGSKIEGQLAKPSSEGKKPALLVVQWAGVYSLQKDWITGHAADGWLVLNIQAHDLPAIGPESFYKQQSDGPLNWYPVIGCEDRETSYFLRMYLSCVRAADYLASRPEWDGKVMVVTGGSQGGLQSLVTAALVPRITGVVANVPAGCDQSGPQVGRAPGWPSWPWLASSRPEEVRPKVMETSRYFDVVNFAPRIKAPVLAGIGGIDTVCPPVGIYAALGLVKGPWEAVYMPLADHMGAHDAYYARSGAWMGALREGKTPSAPRG